MTNKKKDISDAEFIKVAKGEGADVIETLERKHTASSKGKHSFNTGVGNSSQVVSEQRKSPAEMIAEIEELEREKSKNSDFDLLIGKDKHGHTFFEIVEKNKNDIGLTEGDVKFLKENPELLKEIFSIVAGKDTKTKIKEKDLQESVDIEDIFEGSFIEGTVYPNQNLIKGVCLINRVSKNNRVYLDEALNDIVRLSNGIKVNLDHLSRDVNGRARSVKDIIGKIINPRQVNGGVFGDLSVLKSQKDWIFAIAEQMPELAGMSIVAKGRISDEPDSQGRQQVESVTQLSSIDLVSNPATTKGLFENEKTFKEDEDPCKYYRTKDCVVTSFGDDADKCKFTKRNCPFK